MSILVGKAKELISSCILSAAESAMADGSLEKLAGITIEKEHSRVMLCGNPGMVKSVREAMKARGIVSPRGGKPGQLLAENFWL